MRGGALTATRPTLPHASAPWQHPRATPPTPDRCHRAFRQLNDVAFLMLGNKIDLGRAASEDKLRVNLGLHHLTTGKGKSAPPGIRPMELFMCSIVKWSGYGEGFRWLSNYIK